ncbi:MULTISPECIES: outer membrane protein assembly factor BamB [Marinobacterium]|jgi:outer membrane protein assembly factor BamB|uniref:Outer membrane protein assembly factor BamB n=1 Tax=Marinobacterium iners DSM 11526 TaxID=1122198 RepID=A0A1H4GSU7_9GAMM|nr:outer membrane protein assembly factor BamB [Marinobacterium iners]SEB12719.1 Beta-barrel assembly machine subunit BamB [Marinobacterium iners DSM 11526]
MKCWVKTAAAIAVSVSLAGCGLFSSEETVEPNPLVDFEAEQQFQQLWSLSTGGSLGSKFHQLVPSIDEQQIFAVNVEGDLVAADLASGRINWRVELETPIGGGVGAGNGIVVLATESGEVIAFDTTDGSERWRYQASSEVISQPQMNAELVVVQQLDGKITALEVGSGERRWSYDSQIPRLSLRGTSAPIVAADLTLAGFANGKLVAVENASGRPVWEQRISLAEGRSELERIVDIDGKPLVYNRIVYVGSYQGRLVALNPGNGQVVWSQDLSTYRGLAGGFGNVYAISDEDHVHAFDARNSASVWSQDGLQYRRLTTPVVLGNSLVTADADGYLHVLSQVDGHFTARHRVSSSGVQSDLLVRDDVLYVLSNDGRLTALKFK